MCHGHRGRRFGRRGFGSSEDWVRRLEDYQRDLEQELADVSDVIRRLREGEEPKQPETVHA
jgi:hypothetical protein